MISTRRFSSPASTSRANGYSLSRRNMLSSATSRSSMAHTLACGRFEYDSRVAVDLEAKLAREYDKVRDVTTYRDGARRIRQCADWLVKEPLVMAILEEAGRVEPELDFERWREQIQYKATWPCTTAAGEAWLCWLLLTSMAEEVKAAPGSEDKPVQRLLIESGFSKNLNDAYRLEVVPRFFEPLFRYLIEKVGEGSSMLYLATRWVASVQWFEADRLYAEFIANTQQGEMVYDRDLRRFLFDQGVDMPFSQARTPSGQTDVLAALETADPFVGEVKLFGHGREKAGLASGVTQAFTYADEFGKNIAFLVIVNLDDRLLSLPTDGPGGAGVGYLDVAGVRIYLVVANAKPREESASKRGRSTTVSVTRDDLVSGIA
jgi:hypothetical protein